MKISAEPPVFKYVLMKLASRCNINCSYCYWFRDESVYRKPPLMLPEVERAFLSKLRSHVSKYQLESYHIIMHGGEPMLFGKKRFYKLCKELRNIEQDTNCKVVVSLTTNGILVDREWAAMFKHFNIGITISLDGDEITNDEHRKDFKGNGTYKNVIAAIDVLNEFHVNTGFLAVANIKQGASAVFNHYVNDLEINHFDVLIPDATHEDLNVPSIAKYFKDLYTLWYEHPNREGIEIRVIRSFVLGLLSYCSASEGLGFGPLTTNTLLTDGSLEPLDVLRIAGDGTTSSTINIRTHELQDVSEHPIWKEALYSSLNLADECNSCEYMYACGGGYLPHRWSNANRYNNPSVYCQDLKEIFKFIGESLLDEISIKEIRV